jgi:hypothetical protein
MLTKAAAFAQLMATSFVMCAGAPPALLLRCSAALHPTKPPQTDAQQTNTQNSTRPLKKTTSLMQEEALRIDSAALAATVANVSSVPSAVMVGATRSMLSDELLHPRAWARSSAGNISAAEALISDAQGLRRALSAQLAQASGSLTALSARLEETMQQRIRATRKNRQASPLWTPLYRSKSPPPQ